jgi:hypothetical protein
MVVAHLESSSFSILSHSRIVKTRSDNVVFIDYSFALYSEGRISLNISSALR